MTVLIGCVMVTMAGGRKSQRSCRRSMSICPLPSFVDPFFTLSLPLPMERCISLEVVVMLQVIRVAFGTYLECCLRTVLLLENTA